MPVPGAPPLKDSDCKGLGMVLRIRISTEHLGQFRAWWLGWFRALHFSLPGLNPKVVLTTLFTSCHHPSLACARLSYSLFPLSTHTHTPCLSPSPVLPGTFPVVDIDPSMCLNLCQICNVCVFIYINSIVL